MKNRISSFNGMEWVAFLFKQKLLESGEPVVALIERMREEEAFFQVPPIRYEHIEEWKELFGDEEWKS